MRMSTVREGAAFCAPCDRAQASITRESAKRESLIMVEDLGRDTSEKSTTETQRTQRKCTREESLDARHHLVPREGRSPVCTSSVSSVSLWSISTPLPEG